MHVGHLTLDAAIEHDGRGKNNRQVLGRHLGVLELAVGLKYRLCFYAYQVLALTLRNSVQVEHEELEAITVALGHGQERLPQVGAALCLINNAYVWLVLLCTRFGNPRLLTSGLEDSVIDLEVQ